MKGAPDARIIMHSSCIGGVREHAQITLGRWDHRSMHDAPLIAPCDAGI